MHRTLLALSMLGAILAPLTGVTQSTPAASNSQDEERRVLAAEDEYVAAEVSRDEAALRRMVDDRFVFNSSNGRTSGKDELIAEVLKMAMIGQTIRERSVLVEGDIAIVFGTADLKFAGPDSTESLSSQRYTSTYVNRQGQWRMLALQMQKRASE
jgi:ketosteroid isomerase-like protein